MDYHSCVAKRTRSQKQLYYNEIFFEIMKNSCVGKRTRSQKELYYKDPFFDRMKNTDESLPKSYRKRTQSRKRTPSVSRVNIKEVSPHNSDQLLCDTDIDVLNSDQLLASSSSTDIDDPKDDQLVASSDTDNDDLKDDQLVASSDTDNDDPNDEDFDEANYGSVSMEESSSSSEEYEEEDNDIEEVDEEKNEGSNNVGNDDPNDEDFDEANYGSVSTEESSSSSEEYEEEDNDIEEVDEEKNEGSNNVGNDDPNDEDFDEANYGSVSMEESSSSSEEYEEEEDYDMEEVDEEKNEGSNNVDERSDKPLSTEANLEKNDDQLDGVHQETGERRSNFKCDEKGCWKAEESWNSIHMKQSGASEDSDIERRVLKTCEQRRVFKTYERRRRSGKHCSSIWTYECNAIFEGSGKSDDKLNGSGADNEKIGIEKGGWKAGKSTKTEKATEKSECSEGGVRVHKPSIEKGGWKAGKSRKSTKTEKATEKSECSEGGVRVHKPSIEKGGWKAGKSRKSTKTEKATEKSECSEGGVRVHKPSIEKGGWKAGKSRKSTKTEKATEKSECSEGGVRVHKPSIEKGGWKAGKSRKSTKTEKATEKSECSEGGVRVHKPSIEKGGWTAGKSRKSTKTEKATEKSECSEGGVRVHKPSIEKGECSNIKRKEKCGSKTWLNEEDNKFNIVQNENVEINDKFSDDTTNKRDRQEKVGKRDEKPIKRMRLKDYDIFRILADSILDKEEAREKSSSDEYTLPLKFKFEDEEPEVVEKSDFEKMVDNLFAEMNFALQSEEMGSFDPPQDYDKTNVPEAKTNQTTLCRRGKHHLVLDEQVGLRCLHCSYVDIEIKYVLPPLRKYTAKVSERENYIGGEDFFMSDKLDFQASGNNFRHHLVNHTKGTVWDIIPGIRDNMYLHQQEGFEFLWKNLAGTINLAELKSSNSSDVGGCIISHAPGTGKTRLTIIFLNTYLKLFPNCKPVILAPASMLLTWEEEFRKWKIEFPFHNLNNPELSGKENKTALRFLPENKCQNKDVVRMVKLYSWRNDKSILGVSYSLYEKLAGEKVSTKGKIKKQKKVVLDKKVEKWRKILLDLPDLVVLDEGHTPRNQRSCIWNTLLKLQTERRIILSGTPFQNNFGELFNTLRLVRSAVAGLLAKERTFADMFSSRGRKYCRKKSREERAIAGRKIADDAIEMLKATIAPFVHVHKGSILQESLPGLRDCVLLLNPPQLQKHIIDRIEGLPYTIEYEHKVALVCVHPSLLLYCSLSEKENSIIHHDTLEQLRLHPDKGVKTRFVMELVRLSVAMNEKVLIFSQYIHPLELIKDLLKEVFGWNEGKEVLQMQGKLEQRRRQNMINVFNCPKSDAKVLLASIKCCSEGINLVGASRVVLLDVVWNPSVERQAISRAYRLGQKKVVYTYHLMTSGTTEVDKYCRQAEKGRLSELVFFSTNKEKDKERNSTAVFNDKILDEMIGHEKLKDMFEKIIYQPKETNLIGTFGLGSLS